MTATTFRLPSSTRALLLALLAAAAACDGGSDAAPEPVRARLAGRLHPAGTPAAQDGLRLALAWYPGLMSEHGRPVSRPGAVETDEVAYTGDLPLDYAFDVPRAPPASALSPMPEGFVGRGAAGVLLAYQDRNGNRRLDTIPADGSPIDRVVGASLEWTASPAFVVAYLTDDQPAGTGLKAGFNLLRIIDAERTDVVPLSTSIPISISQGGALLDLFVCEAAWDGSGTQAPCGLDLEDPQEGVLDATVHGEIYVGTQEGEAAFSLVQMVNGLPVHLTDATVTLEGVKIPFDAESGFYYTAGLPLELFAQERTVELVATRDGAVLREQIAIPAFEFTEVPETVVSGADFVVAWSKPQSADWFDLVLFSGSSLFLRAGGTDLGPYRVTGVEHVGQARLTVAALARSGTVPVTVVRTTTLEFVAAE